MTGPRSYSPFPDDSLQLWLNLGTELLFGPHGREVYFELGVPDWTHKLFVYCAESVDPPALGQMPEDSTTLSNVFIVPPEARARPGRLRYRGSIASTPGTWRSIRVACETMDGIRHDSECATLFVPLPPSPVDRQAIAHLWKPWEAS
jgi:hypothetical protein